MDLSKGYLPILIVTGMLTVVGIGGVYIGKAIGQLEQLTANVESLTISMKEMQAVFARLTLTDNWKRGDQTKYCLEAERLNPGWKCPEVE